jgi:hypothetical protein
LLTPPIRDLFVTGPGPDVGGPKPGRNHRCHTPEKSGMDAVACLPLAPAAGIIVCAQAGIAVAAANAANKRKSRRCTLMIASVVLICSRSCERGQFSPIAGMAHGQIMSATPRAPRHERKHVRVGVEAIATRHVTVIVSRRPVLRSQRRMSRGPTLPNLDFRSAPSATDRE